MRSDCYHITLVHGTFARNAPWTKPGSVLRRFLRENIPGRIKFHRFRWSGWPSHLARDRAAQCLRSNLSYRINKYPNDRHCVIAHSHGGNIVCYAARDPALAKDLAIITLSTPFLVPRKRLLSLWGSISVFGTLLTLLLVLLFGSILLQIHWWFGPTTPQEFLNFYRTMSEHPFGRQHWTFGLKLSVPILVFVGVCFGIINLILTWYEWLSKTLSLPQLRSDQMFIVRPLADEPNRLLGAAGLFETIVTLFWGHSGAFDLLLGRIGKWGERQMERPLVSHVWNGLITWWTYCGYSFVLILPVSWFFYLTRPHEYVAFILGPYTHTAAIVWACIAVIEAPIVVGIAAAALILIVIIACGITVGIVVSAAILCLALIMLVVVPELGPLAVALAVSTESSPPGTFQVLHIPPPERKLGVDEALMHSATYTNPVALDAIAKFLVAVRGDTATRAAGV